MNTTRNRTRLNHKAVSSVCSMEPTTLQNLSNLARKREDWNTRNTLNTRSTATESLMKAMTQVSRKQKMMITASNILKPEEKYSFHSYPINFRMSSTRNTTENPISPNLRMLSNRSD